MFQPTMSRLLFVLLATAVAQPINPLLPGGVSINMVQGIQVSIPGTVQFLQSTDGTATIASRLKTAPTITWVNKTGILYVSAPLVSAGSVLQPGFLVAGLAVLLSALDSKHNTWLLVLAAGLGMSHAQVSFYPPDVVIRVPGCWHTEGQGGEVSLLWDDTCSPSNLTVYQALANPWPTVAVGEWKPITPSVSFLPGTDTGMHYIAAEDQYEVWRATFGLPACAADKANFIAFTENCMSMNAANGPNRSWTAGCNQFANMAHADWIGMILAQNAQYINSPAGRRLLSPGDMAFSDISESQRRKLLETTSFSWVGTGRLTPVKNQGYCGDCYAHSSTSQMEAALAIATNSVPVPLSREQLKDCASVPSNGCGGDSPPNMFIYAQNGLTSEAALPYQDWPDCNPDGTCPTMPTCPSLPAFVFKDDGYTQIANNEMAFQAALPNAPILVLFCGDPINNYMGGVFTGCPVDCKIDHTVLLVGYGTDPVNGDYWLLQNSWATTWGEQGFIRIPNTHSSQPQFGACGMTQYPGFVAKNPQRIGGATDCQGSWSGWSACSVTCGGGKQTNTWTTTTAASGGGAACPNPLVQSQSCNSDICPTAPTTMPTRAFPNSPTAAPPTNPAPTAAPPNPVDQCIYIQNSVLGSNADGNYVVNSAGWTEGSVGMTLPEYRFTNINGETFALFFFVTNLQNNQPTAGKWGLGDVNHYNSAYQWSSVVPIYNGVIPVPYAAGGWTLQFYVCSN